MIPTALPGGSSGGSGTGTIDSSRLTGQIPIGLLTAITTMSINPQTGTTYTPVLSDGLNTLITLSNGSGIAVTIPTNAAVAYPIGTTLNFWEIGAGQVTVAGDTGVTVNATPGLKARAQHAPFSAVKIGTNTWELGGDLTS